MSLSVPIDQEDVPVDHVVDAFSSRMKPKEITISFSANLDWPKVLFTPAFALPLVYESAAYKSGVGTPAPVFSDLL